MASNSSDQFDRQSMTRSIEIEDAEMRNLVAPDTFWIPDTDRRMACLPGEMVKLHFALADGDLVNHVASERMWVEISTAEGGRYTGLLKNAPVEIDARYLKLGDEVTFEARHIMDVLTPAEVLELGGPA